MYHMTPEEIRQRYLLIDQLDFYIPLAALIFLLLLLVVTFFRARRWTLYKDKCDGGWWRVMDYLSSLTLVVVLGYYIWKTFFAFY